MLQRIWIEFYRMLSFLGSFPYFTYYLLLILFIVPYTRFVLHSIGTNSPMRIKGNEHVTYHVTNLHHFKMNFNGSL